MVVRYDWGMIEPHKNNTKPEGMWFKKYQNSRLAVQM